MTGHSPLSTAAKLCKVTLTGTFAFDKWGKWMTVAFLVRSQGCQHCPFVAITVCNSYFTPDFTFIYNISSVDVWTGIYEESEDVGNGIFNGVGTYTDWDTEDGSAPTGHPGTVSCN